MTCIVGSRIYLHGYSFPFLLLRGKRHERLLSSSPPTRWLSSSATDQMSNVVRFLCTVPMQAVLEDDGISIEMPSKCLGFN